jgi:hypothetical protein
VASGNPSKWYFFAFWGWILAPIVTTSYPLLAFRLPQEFLGP